MNENTITGTHHRWLIQATANFAPMWFTEPAHYSCRKCGAPIRASLTDKAIYTCTCKDEGLL